jgi:hypothetical protein
MSLAILRPLVGQAVPDAGCGCQAQPDLRGFGSQEQSPSSEIL